MRSFLDYIQFKYIPCDVLVKEVYPLRYDNLYATNLHCKEG